MRMMRTRIERQMAVAIRVATNELVIHTGRLKLADSQTAQRALQYYLNHLRRAYPELPRRPHVN